MASGQVTLRGRFSKGTEVELVRVAGEHSLRSEGGEVVATKTVEEENGAPYVQFTTGVERDARYFIRGLDDGRPLEVRVRGRGKDDPSEVLAQPPIRPDRQRLSDGSWSDEKPERQKTPGAEVAPGPSQAQVPDKTPQRSATFRGSGHPVDPDEKAPYRSQEDVPDGTPQASDTRRRELEDGTVVGGGGRAAVVAVGPQRQEDVKGSVPQRSSTPTGTAAVIPSGDAVKVQQSKESAIGKELRGEPGRVAAEPIDKAKAPTGASGPQSHKRHEEIVKSEREARDTPQVLDQPGDENLDTSGLDAQGQPASEDVAHASGVEPADKPAELIPHSEKEKK